MRKMRTSSGQEASHEAENQYKTPQNAAEAEPMSSDQNNASEDDQSVISEPVDDGSALKIAELTNDLQRTRADFENFRKQTDLQRAQAAALAKAATVEKFLPLIDDLDRALSAYQAQLAPLRKSFEKTLRDLGLARIDSEIGTEFNPDFHEAISVEDGEGETEIIAETLRPGYLYDGNVIRAAMVKVKRA